MLHDTDLEAFLVKARVAVFGIWFLSCICYSVTCLRNETRVIVSACNILGAAPQCRKVNEIKLIVTVL